MIAALLPALFGAVAYCIPAEIRHRRKLRAMKGLLGKAKECINLQAVDKMALMGRCEELKADRDALRAELIEHFDRAVA